MFYLLAIYLALIVCFVVQGTKGSHKTELPRFISISAPRQKAYDITRNVL